MNTYCSTCFESSSADSFTMRGTYPLVSMAAFQLRPLSASSCPLRSPRSFSTSGNSSGCVLPRLKSVTV